MATPPLQAAETHQEAQEGLAKLILPLLAQLWGLWNPNRLDESVPSFREALAAVVNHYGKGSAGVAQDYYRQARLDAGVPGKPPAVVVPDVPDGFIDQLVSEALAEAEADMARATAFLDSGAQHLVLEQGRRQLLDEVHLDREARGWTRVVHDGACSFCLMLALRGPVYRTRKSAGFSAHHKQPNGSGGDCRCSVEPVFGHWEPSARVREAERVWKDATKGRSGHDARTAFRQAVEGRDVTGAPGKGSGTRNKRGQTFQTPAGRTPETQRAQLRILEALEPAKTPEAATWRANRIAEIRKYLGE